MNYVLNFIKKSFKLINYIRLFILNMLFIAIFMIVIFSINKQEENIQIVDNAYLQLNLNGFIVEKKQPLNLSQQISNELSGSDEQVPQEFEVQEIIDIILQAKSDPKIIGLTLELNGLRSGSLNQLTSIGTAINAFKAAGKPVLAYADNYTQTQYYLAAYADNVTLAPNGFVLLQGYAVNRLYFKELIDKLLITPHIFKVGTYKSFVEPYTETKMSDFSKEANRHWLNQLWQSYIANVLEQRKGVNHLNAQSINPTLKQLKKAVLAVSGDSAEYALSVGLVDHLAYREQFIESIKEKNNNYKTVTYQTYASTLRSSFSSTGAENKIAVIYGSGEIISGQSDSSSIADKSFNKLLKKALKNPRIKAVVLRLDTPGGSASASENIRQQVLALKKANKKVVISMGSMAASGGYWIASAGDEIIASPTTLTGSIGIFGLFGTIDKSLNNIGIHHDGVSTNALSDVNITQPLAPELAEIFQIGIESGYATFLKIVSEGRNMNVTDVDKVAQGRVWTGVDAHKNGLVDQLGDLEFAITTAANLASLTEYDVVTIKQETSSKQAFINELFSQSIRFLPTGLTQQSLLFNALIELDKQANFAIRMNDPQNRFVYCTVCSIN